MIALTVGLHFRIRIEEKTLINELDGYKDYLKGKIQSNPIHHMISKLEHPLEMLSTEEISLAYEIYKTSEGYDEATHFSQISLVEPTKEFLKILNQAILLKGK